MNLPTRNKICHLEKLNLLEEEGNFKLKFHNDVLYITAGVVQQIFSFWAYLVHRRLGIISTVDCTLCKKKMSVFGQARHLLA